MQASTPGICPLDTPPGEPFLCFTQIQTRRSGCSWVPPRVRSRGGLLVSELKPSCSSGLLHRDFGPPPSGKRLSSTLLPCAASRDPACSPRQIFRAAQLWARRSPTSPQPLREAVEQGPPHAGRPSRSQARGARGWERSPEPDMEHSGTFWSQLSWGQRRSCGLGVSPTSSVLVLGQGPT